MRHRTLTAVAVMFWLSIYAYVPFVTPYAESMQADVRFIGLIAGTYGFVQMAIRFPLGLLSDKLQKRKIFIQAGLLFAAASGVIVFLFPQPMTLFVSRSFAGVTAATWVAFTILAAAASDDAIKVIGRLNAAAGAAKVLAFVFGGAIAAWLGPRHAFLLGGAMGVLGLLLSFGIADKAPDAPAKQTPEFSVLLGTIRNPQLLCVALLAILSQYIQFSTTFGFSPMLAAHLGAEPYHLGLLGLVAAVATVVISPAMGKLARGMGLSSTLAGAFALAAAGSVAMAASQALWQVFAAQFLIALGAAGLMALLMGLAIRDVPDETRATAMGFFQAVYGLGMFLGPSVMGWVSHSVTLAAAFVVTGAVAALGAVLSALFVRKGFVR